MLGHSRRLGISRRGIVFGMNRDHRMTRAVGRHERGGHSGNSPLHLEAAVLENLRHQLRGLELLHAELGEVVDVVA